MRRCTQCHAELGQEDVFCRLCGQKQEGPQTAGEEGVKHCLCCGAALPEEDVFCRHCGQKLMDAQFSGEGAVKRCLFCGFILRPEDAFCTCCGQKYEDASPAPASRYALPLPGPAPYSGLRRKKARKWPWLFLPAGLMLLAGAAALFFFTYEEPALAFKSASDTFLKGMLQGPENELSSRLEKEDFEYTTKITLTPTGRNKDDDPATVTLDCIRQGSDAGVELSSLGDEGSFKFTLLTAEEKLFCSAGFDGPSRSACIDLPSGAGASFFDRLSFLNGDTQLVQRLKPLNEKLQKYKQAGELALYSIKPESFTDLEDNTRIQAEAVLYRIDPKLAADLADDVLGLMQNDDAFYGEFAGIAEEFAKDGGGNAVKNLEKIIRDFYGNYGKQNMELELAFLCRDKEPFALRLKVQAQQPAKAYMEMTVQSKQAVGQKRIFVKLSGTVPPAASFDLNAEVSITPKRDGSEIAFYCEVSGVGQSSVIEGNYKTRIVKKSANQYASHTTVDMKLTGASTDQSPRGEEYTFTVQADSYYYIGSIPMRQSRYFDVLALKKAEKAEDLEDFIAGVMPEDTYGMQSKIAEQIALQLSGLIMQGDPLYQAIKPSPEQQARLNEPESKMSEDEFFEPIPLSEGIKDEFDSFNAQNFAVYDGGEANNGLAKIKDGALEMPFSDDVYISSRPVSFEKGECIRITRKFKINSVQQYVGRMRLFWHDPKSPYFMEKMLLTSVYKIGPAYGIYLNEIETPGNSFALYTPDGLSQKQAAVYPGENGADVEETIVLDTASGKGQWILNDKTYYFETGPIDSGEFCIEMGSLFSNKQDYMHLYDFSVSQTYLS